MDILDHLTQEHRDVEKLIAQLRESEEGAQRDQLVDELFTSLTKHMAVEERFLYPLVVETIDAETETEAEVEHGLAREGLAKLRDLEHEAGFKAALDMVQAGIAHHVEDEEHEVFPQLREKAAAQLAGLDPDELEAKVSAGSDPSATSGEATKAELYERAQAADIPGRSKMTKEELAAAVEGTGS